MHNRIGRRAAVAGVDRMAVEDVVASVLHFLPNEDAVALQRAPGPNPAMRLVPGLAGAPADLAQISHTQDCAFRGRQTVADATAIVLRINPAARRNAGVSPMRGQFVRCRP